jgi:cell division protein FtsQ
MFDSRTNRNAAVPMGKRIPKPDAAAPTAAPEPRSPETRRNGRWLALGVALMTVSVVAAVSLSRQSVIGSVEVSGVDRSTEKQVLQAARIPTGVPLDSAGILSAILRVERLPYVKRASVQTRVNGGVRIVVTERIPVARLLSDTGRAYVDADGVILPVLAGRNEQVPDVTGFRISVGDTLKTRLGRAALAFLTELPNHPLASVTLTDIHADPKVGIVARTTESGADVRMGWDAFDVRLAQWDAFYGQIVPVKGIRHFRTIDLRYRDQLIAYETNR